VSRRRRARYHLSDSFVSHVARPAHGDAHPQTTHLEKKWKRYACTIRPVDVDVAAVGRHAAPPIRAVDLPLRRRSHAGAIIHQDSGGDAQQGTGHACIAAMAGVSIFFGSVWQDSSLGFCWSRTVPNVLKVERLHSIICKKAEQQFYM